LYFKADNQKQKTMKNLIFILCLFVGFSACKNTSERETDADEPLEKSHFELNIIPISHATMVIEWGDIVMYTDPVGGIEAFEGQPAPDLILVTDIHSDHLNLETLEAVVTDSSILIVPVAVFDLLPKHLLLNTVVVANDETTHQLDFAITGVPMYNLREEALQFHEKGRGNGYIIEKDGYRVYISGDTEDIPEMRNLENIDLAFVCMNLPFTMTVESAASAVADFKPKTVIPYHYRGREGFSDVDTFERLVNEKAPEVEVRRIDFYPND
jgi:L-ascorbate metabolism protein UlaG (beta-lactamase superfamily)